MLRFIRDNSTPIWLPATKLFGIRQRKNVAQSYFHLLDRKFSFLVLTRCWCLEHCGKWWSYICICSPCSLIFEYLYRNYSARFTNYNWRIIPAMIIGGDYCMFLKYLPFHLFDVRCLSCLQFVIFAFHQFAYLLFTFWLFIFDLFDRLLWPN